MPDCLLCQNYFDTEEQLGTHMETDHHYAPPKSPWEPFGLDQAAEMVFPMLQEYLNNAAHSSAALKLTEIAVRNNRDIDDVLKFYKSAMESLSAASE